MNWRRRMRGAGGWEAGLPGPSRAVSVPEALVWEISRGEHLAGEGTGKT